MTTAPEPDQRTPVLVGVGQAAERIDDPGYARRSAVTLAADAARAALHDTGVDASAVAAAIDTVAGVRQFENSTPIAQAPLGCSDNYPRAVAGRIGAGPARAVLEVTGGQAPQHLVNEFAAAIAAGQAETVLLVGSDAISTERHLAHAEDRPDFTEHVGGQLEDRGYGLRGLVSRQLLNHGLLDPPAQYALFEHARRARLGLNRAAYAGAMGEVFAPFTRVAAKNPYAAAPSERDATELATPNGRNRMIADPYTRFLVARDQVNQGAAVLLTSLGTARELGIAERRLVFLHGHADLRERALLERADLGASPAATHAVRHALELAGIDLDDLSTIDLYSCFPVAVTNVCDGTGLAPDDPRGLTVTGGLPFFGGPGNNYSMHAITETVQRLRGQPGSYGLVGANGGLLSKYSAGVYSTRPVGWQPDRSEAVQAELDAAEPVPQAEHADGAATIETYTVTHRSDGNRAAVVIGRLAADGRRFIANAHADDTELLDQLGAGEPLGMTVFARSFGFGNRVALSQSRMDELYPPRPKRFREQYEYASVRRDGRLLEVTIDRPQSRNSLHPAANEELDEIFEAYFADPDLWAAILTGAGEQAFCAGNDLIHSASGEPTWMPKNGFAGLTGRRLPKPVIAAVNGYAMGGGFEIALACHLVVADEHARFALSEAKVGLVAAAGGLVRLPRVLPPKLANELIVTGRSLRANEAAAHGLVNRVVDAGTALDGARELAAEVLAASPTSVRTSLSVMAETEPLADTVTAVNQPSSALDDLLVSEDMFEGITAFAQKRTPEWRNR